MGQERESLKPIQGANRALRRRLTLKGEFALAIAPTAIVLGVLALVEALSEQRLLFASLASSAFLIYLDPQHGTNSVRTLVVAQVMAAVLGFLTYLFLGSGYLSGGTAMVITIVLMILLDAVHPPAVSTSLSFALRAGNESNLVLFGLAVGITATLVMLERVALWVLARYGPTASNS
ncbi:HPP family protein [Pseudanabaena sp. FACHB-2040]|uniref:HPP family protein n=1 Tax=Pseudanabaena sp. FACHB-2040 TaxID=2692859 RepID=UPI001689708C|nr:HPP family protein [Pseudanabaena sp. FACHB-2040]MBD2256948.1 HPP family protein [Pseudanabaena sp. FACHB-2040]